MDFDGEYSYTRGQFMKRKFLLILCAVVMCMALRITANAAEARTVTISGDTASISITNVVKETEMTVDRGLGAETQTVYWVPVSGTTMELEINESAKSSVVIGGEELHPITWITHKSGANLEDMDDSGVWYIDSNLSLDIWWTTAPQKYLNGNIVFECWYPETDEVSAGEGNPPLFITFTDVTIDKPSGNEPPVAELVARPTSSAVIVNGENVPFDAYNINDNNYFKIRDVAYALSGSEKQFDTIWDAESSAIRLASDTPYTIVGGEMRGKGIENKLPVPTQSRILLDEQEIKFTAYNIDGNNYFKLRDIAETFDFLLAWDGENNTITIDTSEWYVP